MSHDLHDVRQELRDQLRGHGLRATSARLSVLVELHERRTPMTHDEIMAALGEGSMDRGTVYRILADLSTVGVLSRMDLGDHVWRYELCDPCRDVDDEHAHFLCEGCGQVVCLPPMELRTRSGDLPEALHGAQISLRVTGQCAACVDA